MDNEEKKVEEVKLADLRPEQIQRLLEELKEKQGLVIREKVSLVPESWEEGNVEISFYPGVSFFRFSGREEINPLTGVTIGHSPFAKTQDWLLAGVRMLVKVGDAQLVLTGKVGTNIVKGENAFSLDQSGFGVLWGSRSFAEYICGAFREVYGDLSDKELSFVLPESMGKLPIGQIVVDVYLAFCSPDQEDSRRARKTTNPGILATANGRVRAAINAFSRSNAGRVIEIPKDREIEEDEGVEYDDNL